MKVKAFTISFKHEGKAITASCKQFRVGAVPQVYVCYGPPLKEETFTFYITNKEGQKYFWFTLEEKKELIAKKIAKALEENSSTPKP